MIMTELATNMKREGNDPKRPPPGICRDYAKNPLDPKRLLEWNERFTRGDDRYPKINYDKMRKGTLACTHYNGSLRLPHAHL